jgi:hypothetical protein
MSEEKRWEKEDFEIFGHAYPQYEKINVKLSLLDSIYKFNVTAKRRDGFEETFEGEYHPQYALRKGVIKSYIPASKIGEVEPRLSTTGDMYFQEAVKKKEVGMPKKFGGKSPPMVIEEKFRPLMSKDLCINVVGPAISNRTYRSSLTKSPAHQHFIVYDNEEVYAVLYRSPTKKDEDVLRLSREELPVTLMEKEMHPNVEIVNPDNVSYEMVGNTLGRLRPYTISIVEEEYTDGRRSMPRLKLLPVDKTVADFLRGKEEKTKERKGFEIDEKLIMGKG